MEYIISDTHFGHENIIKYCNRPFRNTTDMDWCMIRKWQNRVKPTDTVYHLGDVGYLKGFQTVINEPTPIQRLVAELPGRKILILGNHDKSAQTMRDVGFDVVCESIIIRVPNMNDTYVLLNHRPMREIPTFTNRSDGVCDPVDFVLHGHIHNSTDMERMQFKNKGELVNIPSFNINCSVEVRNYEPQLLENIVRTHIEKLKSEGKY